MPQRASCLRANPEGRRRILVVESDAGTRKTIAGYLREAGYLVVEAEHGLEALERMSAYIPDVVLLDLDLPLMNGERFVEAVRKEPAFGSAAIVLLSATEDLPSAAAALGVRAALAKPVDLDVLLAVVDRAGQS